ncbi:hypothetical protein HGA91_04680 [candidate division WWE3 bacterium]|nr:hypothetical protein [candidate division WWE3 bacterium]
MSKKKLSFVVVLVLIFFAFIEVKHSMAESIGDTFNSTITFSASENVTAADFTVTVSGGTLNSLTCGGSGFSNLASSGNNCVVFNPIGATSGTLATVNITATMEGTLTVVVTGTLSTSGGSPPTTGQLIGESFTITASTITPTATPSPTVMPSVTTALTLTPSATATPTTTISDAPTVMPTPTLSGITRNLPVTGTSSVTSLLIVIITSALSIGYLLLKQA